MKLNRCTNRLRNYDFELTLFKRRAAVAFIAMVSLCFVLVANLYKLEVDNFSYYQTRANDNRIQVLPISPPRGVIYDRNGKPVAQNIPIYVLEVVPSKVASMKDSADRLSNYIELSPEQKQKLTQLHRSSHKTQTVKTVLSEIEIAQFSAHQHEFPGFRVNAEMKRYYPYGESLTHIVGYVAHINDRDLERLKEEGELANYRATKIIGKLGIERYYENILHGKQGYEEVEVNNRGRVIRTLKYVPPIAGKDLVLNIDVDLQQHVYQLLGDRQGSAVVLDPTDNSVLAMASSPSYDPNPFVDGISGAEYRKLLQDPHHPLLNRATLGVYPPASTVKPFIAIAGLSEKVVSPDTVRNDHGRWQIPGSKRGSKAWRDWRRWGHGDVDVTLAIEESVDSFFYQMAYDLGIDRISDWMGMFGFGQRTGIDIFEETAANMPTREWKQRRHHQPWYKGDTVPIGIGQGYWTATPLQLAKATSVLVNHGAVTSPHILKAVIEHGQEFSQAQTVEYAKTKEMNQVNDAYWDISLNAMRLVTQGSRGSGRRSFRGAKYCSGGKSGTAQVFGLKKDEVYNSKELSKHLLDHGLFTGFAPCENPKYVATVVIEHGNGGARVGAPFIRKVFDYLLVEEKT
ncbi:penicillin-binding protein 2 [Vibrio tetraodonis]|uniref:penicillin-binding protein 2 n=1 Tax=Vibrio tetraodonis TaxID=2231647 RepID=UPI000E0B0B62|nr:penicillin-binding protein 2 [Vibrio tetraodonis]